MTTRTATIEALIVPQATNALSFAGSRMVASFRLLALCAKAGRDPLLELVHRYSCLTTAKAFLDLADAIGASWPENVVVARPCCPVLTPDEMTFARMIDAARAGKRDGFDRQIEGLVRRDLHERLYIAATQYAALV